MDTSTHKDIKFYFCVLIGAAMMFAALYTPPEGSIELSALYGASSFLILAGVIEGADIKGIIREIRLLKESNKNDRIDE